MREYLVAIDVIKQYNVHIDANSEDEAEDIANDMSSVQIEDEGSLKVVETNVVCVEDWGEADDEEE